MCQQRSYTPSNPTPDHQPTHSSQRRHAITAGSPGRRAGWLPHWLPHSGQGRSCVPPGIVRGALPGHAAPIHRQHAAWSMLCRSAWRRTSRDQHHGSGLKSCPTNIIDPADAWRRRAVGVLQNPGFSTTGTNVYERNVWGPWAVAAGRSQPRGTLTCTCACRCGLRVHVHKHKCACGWSFANVTFQISRIARFED